MASRRGGSVRGSLHDSFPCIAGGDAGRLTTQLNEAVAALGVLLEGGDQGIDRDRMKGVLWGVTIYYD